MRLVFCVSCDYLCGRKIKIQLNKEHKPYEANKRKTYFPQPSFPCYLISVPDQLTAILRIPKFARASTKQTKKRMPKKVHMNIIFYLGSEEKFRRCG